MKKVREILKNAFTKYGKDVFGDSRRLVAYLDDWLYEYPVEKKRIALAVNDGIIEKLLFLGENISLENVNSIKYELKNVYKMQDDIADEIISICLYVILDIDEIGELSDDKSYKISCNNGMLYAKEYEIEHTTITRSNTISSNVNIEKGITTIGKKAFSENKHISSISFNDDLICIDEAAFKNCQKLKSITFHSFLERINKEAFSGCSKLKIIEVPESVTNIGDNAFASSGIEQASFFCKTVVLGTGIFKDCISLEHISLPKNMTEVCDMMFYSCKKLTSIALPETVKNIGNMAFAGCKSLSEIHLNDGVQSIGIWAFQECSSLKEIYIPKTVVKINDFAFEGCNDVCIVTQYGSVASSFADKHMLKKKIV